MVEAVVFDVDGVLVRDGGFGRLLSEEHGIPVEQTAAFFRGPFRDCVLDKADLKEVIAPFLKQWGWPGSVEECINLWFEADAVVHTETLDVVDRIRAQGIPCYVASTQERYRAAYLENVIGLRERFDELFFSCRVGCSKPDAAFYDHVARTIGVAPGSLLFLDDLAPNVEGARAAGWNAELYTIGDDLVGILKRYSLLHR